VTDTGRLVVHGIADTVVVDAPCDALRQAWQKPLAW
jgi:hypothetical protein